MEIHNGGVYKLRVTKGILDKYLKKLGLTTDSFDKVNVRLFVLTVIKDFLDKNLKIDDLTYITTQVFYEIKKPHWFNYDNELFTILSETTEASWYKWKSEEKYKDMVKFLSEYYFNNKHFLNS